MVRIELWLTRLTDCNHSPIDGGGVAHGEILLLSLDFKYVTTGIVLLPIGVHLVT